MKASAQLVIISIFFCSSNGQRFKSFGSVVLGTYAPATENYTKTYYLSKNIQSDWMGAASLCRNVGMTLATLDSLAEAKYFLGLCEANRKWFEYKLSDLFFIGGVSPDITDRQTWSGFSTGKKNDYPIPWSPGEPNDYSKDNLENCLSVVVGTDDKFGINDIVCYWNHQRCTQFICQESTLKGKGNSPISG